MVADSVALACLLNELDYNFILAHCNFNLRGEESDTDERFVRDLSLKLGVNLHVKYFNTSEYANEKKISIQMAARKLRYNWFEELRKELNADYIAIAHHKNDDIETFFINLIRGSGIRGFLGMKQKRDKIIRPLLPFNRDDIEDHLHLINQKFRSDSSNEDTKYLRNNIRKNLVPNILEMNPSFISTFSDETEYLSDVFDVFLSKINELKKDLISYNNDDILIDKQKLLNLKENRILLREIISEFGFTESNKILESCKDIAGKLFYSKSHILLVDREYLMISVLSKKNNIQKNINDSDTEIENPISLKLHFSEDIIFNKNKKKACFDANKLKFPLQIRQWEEGDFFFPIGMNGSKKLSDYFIDEKFSRFKKEKTFLLCSEGEIVWIIGHRMDDRFKITQNTKKVYIAELF